MCTRVRFPRFRGGGGISTAYVLERRHFCEENADDIKIT